MAKGLLMSTLPDSGRLTKDEAFRLADQCLDEGGTFNVALVEFLQIFAEKQEIARWARRRGVPWSDFDPVAELAFQGEEHLRALEAWMAELPETTGETDSVPDIEESGDSEQLLEGWSRPTPFGFHDQLPAFPLGALPPWLRDTAGAVAEFTQTPMDLAAMLILAVLASLLAKRVFVRVRNKWTEPLSLYILVALASGEGKSPVFRLLVKPVKLLEERLGREAAPVIRELQARKKVAEADAKTAQKAAEDAQPPMQQEDESQPPMQQEDNEDGPTRGVARQGY